MHEMSRQTWENGPRIVAIGGGHGLSNMLRGLKRVSRNLTAIVSVSDDGGGSGVLRQDLGMPPPGDIRNCMQALANVEPLMEQLLDYRFTEGRLSGQSFGNLLLAALNGIMPSFDRAVAGMSQVLAISGRVLPVTTADVQLEAELQNGQIVLGESKIPTVMREQGSAIARVRLVPERPAALGDVLTAIRAADLILLGPGSLYTSVIPNLLVKDVADEICRAAALKIYVCNIMTQWGETEGYTVGDHVAALLEHSGAGLLDLCLVNSSPVRPELLARYRAEGGEPLVMDAERVAALGVEAVEYPLVSGQADFARHSPDALAAVVLELYSQRVMRVAGEDGTGRIVKDGGWST